MSLNKRKSQSILEYIILTVVFTTVGIATFFAGIKNTAISRAGTNRTYYSDNTDMGKIVNKGIKQGDLRWPSKWGMYSNDAYNYENTIGEEQIAKPQKEKGYSYGESPAKLYEYKPLNWSFNKELMELEKNGQKN